MNLVRFRIAQRRVVIYWRKETMIMKVNKQEIYDKMGLGKKDVELLNNYFVAFSNISKRRIIEVCGRFLLGGNAGN